MNETAIKETVPIYKKMTLTIREATEYSNIGIHKIGSMRKALGCPLVLYVWKLVIYPPKRS